MTTILEQTDASSQLKSISSFSKSLRDVARTLKFIKHSHTALEKLSQNHTAHEFWTPKVKRLYA